MKNPTGTREWASSGFNITMGCPHACRYCYSRASAVQRGLVTDPEAWTKPVPREGISYPGKRKGTIMFPTEHDITPENLDAALTALRMMLSKGNRVLIVSKPHFEVIRTLCRELAPYKSQVLFRFTIGGMTEALAFWEPGAPTFTERLLALGIAYMDDWATSVSMEPLLETQLPSVVSLVDMLSDYITDSIWIGKANHLKDRLTANGFGENPEVMDKADALIASQTDKRIWALYEALKDRPEIKWKDSIKQVVGLEAPEEIGMDR